MAPPPSLLRLLAVFSFVLALRGGSAIFANAIPETELDAMVAALRERGYHLFPNAIMTSDLHLRLLDGDAFTIFAPTDAAVFSLDMTSASAADYLRSLLFHVSPLRLTLSSLRSLPSPASFPSLLDSSHHNLSASPTTAPDSQSLVSVDGVHVLLPGIYYGPHVAVHGLDGILDVRQSRDAAALPPAQYGYDYTYPSAPKPQPNPPQRSEAPASAAAPAETPATFPVGAIFGSISEYRSATTATGDTSDGSRKSEAGTGGFFAAETAAGNPGEKRRKIVLAPSSAFEAIAVVSEPPMVTKDECPAVSGDSDYDSRSVAAATKCRIMAEAEDYPVPTAEDIEISYEDALRGGPIKHHSLPDDLF